MLEIAACSNNSSSNIGNSQCAERLPCIAAAVRMYVCGCVHGACMRDGGARAGGARAPACMCAESSVQADCFAIPPYDEALACTCKIYSHCMVLLSVN